MDFRECGDCTECCKNLYIEDVYGHSVRPGSPCFFLCPDRKCTIHQNRPETCRNFQCAWTQNILPEWMKPNKSGILVSVEKWGEEKEFQMLRAIPVNGGYNLDTFVWLLEFCMETKTPLAYQLSSSASFKYLGSSEFLEYFKNRQ